MSEKLDLETALAALKRERAEIDITIAKLESMLGLESNGVDSPENNSLTAVTPKFPERSQETQELQPDTFFRMSMPAAAKKFLNMVKRPVDTKEIASALKSGGILTQAQDFPLTVHSGLTRDKNFIRVDKKWGLTAWYPGKAATASKKRKKESTRKTKKRSKKVGKAKPDNQGSSED